MDFGTTIRNWRQDERLTLRELAGRADMDYTYLSRIEAGIVAPPSEDKIRALAAALDRGSDDLDGLLNLARASKISAEIAKAAVVRNPEVGALLRTLKDRRLPPEEAANIRDIAERLGGGPREAE